MYESVPQKEHPALARTSHDERARQLFAKDFRKYILLDVPRSTRRIWETEVGPAVATQAGSTAIDHQTVRDAMWRQGFLRAAMGCSVSNT